MKNLLFPAIGICLLLLTSGCLISLHPLYTPDKIVYRPELTGTWQVQGEAATMVFEPVPEKKGYLLTYQEKPGSQEAVEHYEVYLLRLGNHYFIDFYPDIEDVKYQDLTLATLLPTHGFARIDLTSRDEFTLHLFDIEWLEELFRQRRIRLQHEVTEDGLIVLTAPSEELQKFVSKYAEDERAYLDPSFLKKRSD